MWAKIIGVIVLLVLVVAVLFGIYSAVKAVLQFLAPYMWIVGGILALIVIAIIGDNSFPEEGSKASLNSRSDSDIGWGDESYDDDSSSKDSWESNDEPEQGAYHLGSFGTPGYYYDHQDDPDDPDYDASRYSRW